MQLGPEDAAAAVERHPCPQCDVPAGSACRTRAAKYHTAPFILVPSLRDELTVPVPADRGPGKKWTQRLEVAQAPPETNRVPIRIGYARCSTVTQELQSQLLQATGIQLELLSGPLTGIYDPHGMGSMLFARALRDKGTPMPDIVKNMKQPRSSLGVTVSVVVPGPGLSCSIHAGSVI
ncbi:hypothetical protein ACGFNP_00070 [Nonomuraea sp. NPDC049269]|uniref:zinc finger domain-containing protein n=1 Tax=Nonomuraea sp. NPDC049269 TaxID=3364349 RepID=UPI00371219ED